MRIGIDARFFGPLGKGLGRYTQKLISNLVKIDQDNDYYIFLRSENFDHFNPDNPRWHKVKADFRWYSLSEQIGFPKTLRRYKLDLMHFPHFNVPILYFGHKIVTIHDLIITNYPTNKATTLGPLKYLFKQVGYKVVIWLAIKRAKKIITVSQYSKEQILKHFRVKQGKIVVTYEGCDPANPAETNQTVLAKYKIEQPYLLYVGNVYPHKNIENLLKSFADVAKQRPNLKLVLVGKEDYFYKRIKRQVDDLNLLGRVIFPGFVPDADLGVIYQQALAYIFPSLEEGFGLPPLEAMSYGVPVISSSSSCLKEILEEAAYYFNPYSVEQISSSILAVVDDQDLRAKLISKGYQQVKKYDWSTLANKTLKIYQDVL